ncbi:unnamed protein product, partial [marine sediment metagenome]
MKDLKNITSFNNGVAFPGTQAINATGPETNDGTEYSKAVLDEFWGMMQAILVEAGKTPSGSTEIQGASDIVASFKAIIYKHKAIAARISVDNAAGDVDHDLDFTIDLPDGSQTTLTKQFDAAWAEGNNASALSAGSIP